MSPEKIEEFRSLLRQRRKELEAYSEMSAEARAAVELDQSSVGRVSRIDAIQQQAMALVTERNRERDLQRIKAALVRIDEGEFGYCVDCGENIAEKRLEFDPSVPQCVDCAA